jgi:hypothetical protein
MMWCSYQSRLDVEGNNAIAMPGLFTESGATSFATSTRSRSRRFCLQLPLDRELSRASNNFCRRPARGVRKRSPEADPEFDGIQLCRYRTQAARGDRSQSFIVEGT